VTNVSDNNDVRALIIIAISLVLSSAIEASSQTLQPAGWDAGVKLAEAVDINGDPHIVEINLKAQVASVTVVPGVPSELWTYKGCPVHSSALTPAIA
jgi:hypothetical protein